MAYTDEIQHSSTCRLSGGRPEKRLTVEFSPRVSEETRCRACQSLAHRRDNEGNEISGRASGEKQPSRRIA